MNKQVVQNVSIHIRIVCQTIAELSASISRGDGATNDVAKPATIANQNTIHPMLS